MSLTEPSYLTAPFTRTDFGTDFRWGTATAAYQIEGATTTHGRGPSIWDSFAKRRGKIKNGHHAEQACEHYCRYEGDLELVQQLGFGEYRFSISWSRLLPNGIGNINQEGVDFYHRIIDKCLSLNIEPWITLYHWDLPQALQNRGGWKNRAIVDWFTEYTDLCTREYGSKVKNWLILNEPMAVAALGYTTGQHAPGQRGLHNFLPVVHHLALCQAAGGRAVRRNVPDAFVGTTFSCSSIEPFTASQRDSRAARRVDALMNRLFIEPCLGLGYPTDAFPFLKKTNQYMLPGDEEKLRFDFDFVGLQNYFRVIVRHSYLRPVLWASEVKSTTRPRTAMDWEIAPEGMYAILKQFGRYPGIKQIIISENGAAFPDELREGQVHDPARIDFFSKYLQNLLRAKREGVNVKGYFVWSLLDNFEWAEGYDARFGLVHVDYATQQRTVKSSGRWFANFLRN
ncbi:beta-glucosidase [Cytophagaceae bacterium SJW1-29]|uniref:Beta-glucosidase n=1 Tax=Salmonirosea aquatica TaxID=2654236 RepID=A0A7C9BG36_9BACT|nr:beta-glucosidase [Cytophagaceae bacterium SJW1-29]